MIVENKRPPFPAIVIGGPPHSGKSVLIHALTAALRRHGMHQHYVLRANPDGEGDWANEAQQLLVKKLRQKGAFTQRFIDRAAHDLENRPLPFLVDVGGKPREWQEIVFKHCTHGVLLIADNQSEIRPWWQALYRRHNIQTIADLTSTLVGFERVRSSAIPLMADIANLERGRTSFDSHVVDVLVQRICAILGHSDQEITEQHIQNAPLKSAVDLITLGQSIGVAGNRWDPRHLQLLASRLRPSKAVAYYGRGPVWLYGFLAAHHHSAEFWQFDARLGWIQPPSLTMTSTADQAAWQEEIDSRSDYTIVKYLTASEYLSIRSPDEYPIQSLATNRGVILSGKLPFWLLTALVKQYQQHHPWIACYQPQVGAVIVSTTSNRRHIGDVIAESELNIASV